MLKLDGGKVNTIFQEFSFVHIPEELRSESAAKMLARETAAEDRQRGKVEVFDAAFEADVKLYKSTGVVTSLLFD